MTIDEEQDARKAVIKEEGAWELLQDAEKIYIGKGKKTLEFEPTAASKEELLKNALGRTGNLRAPTLRSGKIFFVGYNQTMYEDLLK